MPDPLPRKEETLPPTPRAGGIAARAQAAAGALSR